MIVERLLRRDWTLKNPPDWLEEAWTGGRGPAGVAVNERNALKLGAVFAAVRVVAETISTLPVHVYERVDSRSKRRVPDHPLAYRLNLQANPETTAQTLWENVMGLLLLWGRAPVWIERDATRAPSPDNVQGLWTLPPNKVRELRFRDDDYTLAGYAVDVTPAGHQPMTPLGVEVSDMLDFRAFGYDSMTPIARHADTIGLGLAQEEYSGRLMGNDGRPGGVVEVPADMRGESVDRLIAKWKSEHEGLSRTGLVGFLTGGAQWKDVGMPPEDAQLIESRRFGVEEIARAFRVQPHKIMHLERATFSNIEHQAIEFVTDTILPWVSRLEPEIRVKLFGATQATYGKPGDTWASFLVDGLLRGDIEARYRAYAIGRMWGWLSADDVNEMEDRAPLPDGVGQVYLQPGNMLPAGTEPLEVPPNGNGQGRELSHLPPSAVPASLIPSNGA